MISKCHTYLGVYSLNNTTTNNNNYYNIYIIIFIIYIYISLLDSKLLKSVIIEYEMCLKKFNTV